MPEPRKFARIAPFGRERTFPELGVVVVVEKCQGNDRECIITVTATTRPQRCGHRKGLTPRRRKE